FRSPWSESIDPTLGFEARVREFQQVEDAEHPYSEVIDPCDAADLLVAHAVVPLCDDGLLDRVLQNAQKISAAARVLEIGAPADHRAPMAWRSMQLQGAFAPPQGGL
ncbi:MAG: hypothetical protein CL933_00005, partial [Deltaproteobacteria bacterium]|nr:hypothetical protein [Deltaproteobacteria bacterium]